MIRRLALIGLGLTLACHPPTPPLPKAGARGDRNTAADDGAGNLAHQSIQLLIDTRDPEDPDAPKHDVVSQRYGRLEPEDTVGGASYGGHTYSNWRPPVITTNATRPPRYVIASELHGALEGTVSWGGPTPGKLTTACGVIDNPSVRVGANHALAGALVYIERVSVGRSTTQNVNRPPQVGGVVIKRACALLPTAQIATPVPVQLAVDADTRARLVVTSGVTPARPFEVQDGGRALVTLATGVTRIDAADTSLVPAWVVVLETPYYALTDDSGHFRIDDLAPGTYDVTFWQAPLVTSAHGKLEYGAPYVVHRTMTAGATTPGTASVILGR